MERPSANATSLVKSQADSTTWWLAPPVTITSALMPLDCRTARVAAEIDSTSDVPSGAFCRVMVRLWIRPFWSNTVAVGDAT